MSVLMVYAGVLSLMTMTADSICGAGVASAGFLFLLRCCSPDQADYHAVLLLLHSSAAQKSLTWMCSCIAVALVPLGQASEH